MLGRCWLARRSHAPGVPSVNLTSTSHQRCDACCDIDSSYNRPSSQ
jgi:hypothetical protein